jgi:hypothetical protein
MPRYSKKKWKNYYVKNSHNCYSYMLDKINKHYVKICKDNSKKTRKKGKKLKKKKCGWLKAQPGQAAGLKDVKYYKNYSCNYLNKRVLKDNKEIFMTKKNKCPKDHYKGMLFIQPKRAYHFYRQDDNGNWSHKNGLGSASNKDARGKIIKDPKKASRDYRKQNGFYLSRNCGTYCIPRSSKKKFFSAYTRKKRKKGKKKRKTKKNSKRSNRKRSRKR